MKLLISLICLVALGEVYSANIPQSYHQLVGIAEAKRIRASEQATDFDGSSRIVGGSVASLGQYPHYGGLLITLHTGDISICGSALLSNTKIVTAAHCWSDNIYTGLSLEVVLGSLTLFTGGTRVRTSNVVQHPSFNVDRMQNDIAVATIPHVAYTNVIRPIGLPSGYQLFLTFVGNRAQVAGHGRIRDNTPVSNNQVLSHITVEVIPNLECQAIYGWNVIESTLCTSGFGFRGPCRGDSGGPLSLTFSSGSILIGVMSFTSINGCEWGAPAGYARVTSFTPWLNARLLE